MGSHIRGTFTVCSGVTQTGRIAVYQHAYAGDVLSLLIHHKQVHDLHLISTPKQCTAQKLVLDFSYAAPITHVVTDGTADGTARRHASTELCQIEAERDHIQPDRGFRCI